MVRLDRIKIITPLNESVEDFNESYFTSRQDSEGKEQEWILSSKSIDSIPYLFYVKFDFTRNELVLEFSAKALGEKYPEGITYENLSNALDNISPYVKVDKSIIYQWADVTSVDVKNDFSIRLEKEDYQNFLLYLKYQKNFDTKSYESGVVFKRILATKNRNYLLKFYNKEIEIGKRKNEPFLSTIEDSESLVNAFEGTTRVEFELKSKYLIRKYFNTSILSLDNILSNNVDPLGMVCQEIFDFEYDIKGLADISTLSEYKQYLLVKECEFKLDRVESELRRLMSKKSNIRSAIIPYKKIIANHSMRNERSMISELINKII